MAKEKAVSDLFPVEFVCVVKEIFLEMAPMFTAECRRVEFPHDEIIAAFRQDEAPESDRALIAPGAIFDWRLTDESTESITFRRDTRTNAERERDRQVIANEAREMMDMFGIADENLSGYDPGYDESKGE